MARSRNIKPAFFKNYELADCGAYAQLLFAGLWCLADRDGLLENKPRLIKAELFPYYDVDINGELTKLQRLRFVELYTENGIDVIAITNFKKHQSPHATEKKSELPKKTESSVSNCISTGNSITVGSPLDNDGKPPDSLSLIPDSPILIPDSLIPSTSVEPLAGDTPKPKKPAAKKEPAPTTETWNAYAAAYERRYRVPPVRNAAVNGQLSQLVYRLGAIEAPLVAAWYVNHQNQFYVGGGHSVGLLLRDCEKLRTQWATGRQVTATQALQADKTQTNLSAFSSMIEEAKGREHAVS